MAESSCITSQSVLFTQKLFLTFLFLSVDVCFTCYESPPVTLRWDCLSAVAASLHRLHHHHHNTPIWWFRFPLEPRQRVSLKVTGSPGERSTLPLFHHSLRTPVQRDNGKYSECSGRGNGALVQVSSSGCNVLQSVYRFHQNRTRHQSVCITARFYSCEPSIC